MDVLKSMTAHMIVAASDLIKLAYGKYAIGSAGELPIVRQALSES